MNFEQMLPYLLVAAAVILLIAVFVFFGRRSTTVVGQTKGDVLDEGAEGAKRNQALIDAPTAVARDVGITSANANSNVLAAAVAEADAEAGVAVAPTVGDPVPEPVAASAPAGGDDLSMIKGVGPKLVTMLNQQGITSFAQIAAWSESDIETIDATLGRFAGRIARDQWVEQAKLLEKGDISAFTAKFGQNA